MYRLKEIREKCVPVFARYGIGKVVLFGSYARGDAGDDSDLDFYIADGGDSKSLLEISGMYLDFAEIFVCPVDILSGKIQNPDLYDSICREGVIIYEDRKKCHNLKKDDRLL